MRQNATLSKEDPNHRQASVPLCDTSLIRGPLLFLCCFCKLFKRLCSVHPHLTSHLSKPHPLPTCTNIHPSSANHPLTYPRARPTSPTDLFCPPNTLFSLDLYPSLSRLSKQVSALSSVSPRQCFIMVYTHNIKYSPITTATCVRRSAG